MDKVALQTSRRPLEKYSFEHMMLPDSQNYGLLTLLFKKHCCFIARKSSFLPESSLSRVKYPRKLIFSFLTLEYYLTDNILWIHKQQAQSANNFSEKYTMRDYVNYKELFSW